MDQRERFFDRWEELQAFGDARLARAHTAMPGVIMEWFPDKMTCTVQPVINYRMLVNQTWQEIELPPLLDCPVHFPAGGGVTVTFPIKPGDECLVVFAERCIDKWWQLGGFVDGKVRTRPQLEIRMHNLSDGFVIPKVWSQPAKLSAISTDSAQMRTTDGSAFVELKEDGNVNVVTAQSITMTAGQNVTINTGQNVTVNCGADATVTAENDITVHAKRDMALIADRDLGITIGRNWNINSADAVNISSDTAVNITAPQINEN